MAPGTNLGQVVAQANQLIQPTEHTFKWCTLRCAVFCKRSREVG